MVEDINGEMVPIARFKFVEQPSRVGGKLYI